MTGSTAAQRRALGTMGERIAEQHLVAAGMVVLDRNWRCAVGEIDLVLRDGDVLVVCEVKTRTSTDHGTPHEAVGEAKLDRLRRLGTAWQHQHDLAVPDVRIDLVAVLRPRRGPSVVEHVRGIG
jgi:putative endonuclease